MAVAGGRRLSGIARCQLITLIGLTAALLQQVSAAAEFQVQLQTFINDDGLAADGRCCEFNPSSSSSSSSSLNGRCSNPCRTFFRICLSHYQVLIPDEPTCTYGESRTDVIGGNSFEVPMSSPHSSSSSLGDRRNSTAVDNPVRFPFAGSWPGSFTVIIEAYHDLTGQGPKRGSPRRLIWRHQSQHILASGAVWQNATSPSKAVDAVGTFGYRIVCTDGYYGTKCDTPCKDRDDKFGHFTCNRVDGSRDCHAGWSGYFCDKPICLPGCSNKTGGCDNPNECKCANGWQGALCDHCAPFPGCHHGTCQQPWECNCLPGWQGLYCNQDSNFCSTNRPCRNGATCRNVGEGSYECTCLPGYAGINCQLVASDCSRPESPCFNGGTCVVDEVAGSAIAVGGGASRSTVSSRCRCPPGWRGSRCESRVADTCDDRPCRNGGACVAMTTGVGGDVDGGATNYRCTCPAGFTGINCEQEIDECSSQPCQHGGRCLDDVNRFRCVCPAGYAGIVCQTNVDDCAANPCLNNGECIDELNGFRCNCGTGYGGTLCQDHVNECASSPCPTNSKCQNLVDGFRCICPIGITDPLCSGSVRGRSSSSSPVFVSPSDPCRRSPCLNGASCVDDRRLTDGRSTTSAAADDDDVDNYSCRCPPGFVGRRCESLTVGADSTWSVTTDESPLSSQPNGDTFRTASPLMLPPRETQEVNSSSMDTLIQVILIAGLGVLVPLIAIGVTVVGVCVVRRRRRRLKRRSATAAIFIDNDTSNTGSNNRLSSRDNQLNAAVASAASVRYSRKLLADDDESACGGKPIGAGSFVDVRVATDVLAVHGGGGAASSCSFIKLTNHQQQQQREQQQQQQQKQHNSNIYRSPSYGARRSVYGDPSLNLLSPVSSASSRSVVAPLKTTNVEPRRCYGDIDAANGDDDLKAATAVMLS